MACILARPALLVVITLSLSLSAGCSGLLGDPLERANALIAEANQDIDEHNRLSEEARATYTEAKEAIEAGNDPSGEAERITQTREAMEEAQGSLVEAREPLAGVQNLDVEPEVKEYAALLSEAVDAQIAAEDREIEFYRILEEDPALENDRERALEILGEVRDGYRRAEDAYGRAQEIADANPELIRES